MQVEIETVQHGPILYETLKQSTQDVYNLVITALNDEKNLTLPTSIGWTIIPFEVLSTSIIGIRE